LTGKVQYKKEVGGGRQNTKKKETRLHEPQTVIGQSGLSGVYWKSEGGGSDDQDRNAMKKMGLDSKNDGMG